MYIYKTTCLVNGKIYIGQTIKKLCKSSRYLGSGVRLCLAIKKYGKHNFTKEILKENIPNQRLLDAWEQVYIKKYNSTNPIIGYNLLKGAPNAYLGLNLPTDEVKRKLSAIRKEFIKNNPEEWDRLKENMLKGSAKFKKSEECRLLFLGENNPFFGKKHTEEVKQRHSDFMKGHKYNVGSKRSEESKKKMSGENHPMYGKKWTDEQKKHQSDKIKGRKHSEATKKLMRESQLKRLA